MSLMKILASNFTDRLITGNIIENEKLGQKGPLRGHVWPAFRILGPIHISRMVENFVTVRYNESHSKAFTFIRRITDDWMI